MIPLRTLVTITEDPSVVRITTGAVDSTPKIDEEHHCPELHSASLDLATLKPAAVLVDIDARPEETLADLEELIAAHPRITFIVIASEQRVEWVLRAMQAGARDFLAKATMSSTLPGVLDRLVPTTANGQLPNRMVTVLSAAGGCGATTLAMNLTHELYALTAAPTLMIDMDCLYGGATECLGLTSQYGLADVLSDSERIDDHLIRSTAITYDGKWQILVSPQMYRGQILSPSMVQHIPRLLRAAQHAFANTVIDAPRMTYDAAAVLAGSSTMTIILFQANVVDIRSARLLLDALLERGIDRDRIRPLVNRYRRGKGTLPIRDLQKAMRTDRIGRLSNDFKRALSGTNYGKPLAEAAPRSSLRREIIQLARGLLPPR